MATTARSRKAPAKASPARKRPAPAAKAAKAPKAAPALKRAPAPAPARAAIAKPAQDAVVGKADKASKAGKAKKPKLVRDSYTIPKSEYAVLAVLKERAVRTARPAKKSELLRAGLQVLAGLDDAAFSAALGAVPALKTGRPAKA